MNGTKSCLMLAILLAGGTVWGGTVGLWKDARSYISDGMLKTLTDAGWQTAILQGNDLSDETKLAGLDVVFLPGGWNAYWFADFNARRSLVKFVAGGRGILAGAFRSGYVRTANRPLFPEVGATYNRVNGPWISASGDSDLAKAIDKPFCPNGWDHLVVKVGPLGKVFAVSGADPVGVYGDVHGGRYLIFGAFIGMDAKTEPMQGTSRQALLKMLEWLAAAPKLSDADKVKHQSQADLEFLRRERLWDWTLNERGPDRGCGVIPSVRGRLAIPLQSRQYALQYMSQFLSGKKRDAALSENEALRKEVELLDTNTKKALADAAARIGRMSVDELLADKAADARDAMRGTFFPAARLAEVKKRADTVINELRPLVKAAKAERLAREHKEDLARVSKLKANASSPEVTIRRETALELGRIGDPKAAPTLLKMLNDADERVRVNAILGLGWMQSKKAVPELIKLAQGDDVVMRRRAVQALGQIGDAKAADALMDRIADSDLYTAENAILALGWLKAKPAVTPLLQIVTGLDQKDRRQRRLALAAVRAIGHIGDPAALPALEKLEKETDDFPWGRRGGKGITNVYSTAQSLGLKGHAALAIAEIKVGGRSEIGIRQADFLAAEDKFYGLTRRFNALAGRTDILRNANFTDEPAALWPYLWQAGFTGVHQAWGEQDNPDPEKYVELVQAASEFDLLWIDIMPEGSNTFGGRQVSSGYGPHGVEKPGADVVLLRYQDVPAFHGFWWEETYPDTGVPGAEFEAWLKNKHGAEFRKKLDVPPDFDVAGTEWATWSKTEYPQTLKVEFLNCAAERLLGSWQESQDWLHGLRKGCAFTYSVSEAQPVKYPGVAAKAGAVIDVNGPETYQCFGRFNSFFMELFKDGEARPAMSEFYNWYSPSPAHDIRGFAQHLMHGECFYNFVLTHIFELQPYDLWSWDASRWDNAGKVFRKARNIREYLAVPESAANVGLVISERSVLAFDPINLYVGGLGHGWMQHQSALWTALNQSQVPTDVLWAETLTPEKLKRYRVLVLADARIVTEEQAATLRSWVNAGGTLIASGTASLFDDWGRAQKDYQMADLLGVNYAGHGTVSDASKNDTYYWIQGGSSAEPTVPGLNPGNFKNYIHRDLKPVKSIGTYTVAGNAGGYLPGMAAGATCEYDMPLGYDKAKPTTADVLATFVSGDPALTVNRFGKGLCYFWTPLYPGLCHVTSEWEMLPNTLTFWPNVRELLAAMVKGGLAHQGTALPVEVTGVSREIEVTVRQQPAQNRWMVHLFDYDVKSRGVKGAALSVHPPTGKTVKRIFYPDTNTEVAFRPSESAVTGQLRDFEVHDMVVIEWNKP
ncbi:MAG: HEAT repeat domain-containing protein [Planctomycetes bacterium]|nr:HEAT repeat domain-containing protein [Planctomycetota bacterium]